MHHDAHRDAHGNTLIQSPKRETRANTAQLTKFMRHVHGRVKVYPYFRRNEPDDDNKVRVLATIGVR